MSAEPRASTEGLPSYVLNYGGAEYLTDAILSMAEATATLADLRHGLRTDGPLSEAELDEGAAASRGADHMHTLLVGAAELVRTNDNRWKYLWDALAQAFFDYHAARREWRDAGGRV